MLDQAFVISANKERRHLTSSQLAFVALEVESVLAAEAKKRQIRKPANSVSQKIDEQNTQPKAAEKVKAGEKDPGQIIEQGRRTDILEIIPKSD